jgi:hypothetical protein
MKSDPSREKYAIQYHSSFGPTFGDDIYVANNANTTMYNYSQLGKTFKHPQYEEETNEAKTFLAGSFHFQLDEIEVYEKKIEK